MRTKKTRHARHRQRQRSIHPDVVELTLREGVPLSRNDDRLLLNRRRVQELRSEGEVDAHTLDRAEKAVPLVCVLVGENLVTAFRVNRSINRGC